MKKNKQLTSLLLVLLMVVLIIITGTAGFMLLEGYRLLDAFYMTIITVGTVGFREIKPLSDNGKLFTIFLIIMSFGSFGYLITTFTKIIVEGFFRNYFQYTKMKNRIQKLSGHIIVCGYGNNGSETVLELLAHNERVVVIEKETTIIERLRTETELLFIEGDATRESILKESNIERAKALITTMPNDADNLYVVLTAKELNDNLTIVSRASDDHSIKKLRRAGATNVIMPDKIGGNRMASLVVRPDVVEFMEYIFLQQKSDTKVEEVTCRNSVFVNKSIRDLDVRNASGANILGIRTADGNYMINPSADTVLHGDDKLFVLGSPAQIEKLRTVIRG